MTTKQLNGNYQLCGVTKGSQCSKCFVSRDRPFMDQGAACVIAPHRSQSKPFDVRMVAQRHHHKTSDTTPYRRGFAGEDLSPEALQRLVLIRRRLSLSDQR